MSDPIIGVVGVDYDSLFSTYDDIRRKAANKWIRLADIVYRRYWDDPEKHDRILYLATGREQATINAAKEIAAQNLKCPILTFVARELGEFEALEDILNQDISFPCKLSDVNATAPRMWCYPGYMAALHKLWIAGLLPDDYPKPEKSKWL